MPFFDFHLHPSLKPQMSLPPGFPSPWEIIKIQFAHPSLFTMLLKCGGITEVVDSQASLTQLVAGKVNLVAIALHPPESNMMKDDLIVMVATDEQTQYINIDRVKAISKGNIYFEMLNDELKNLTTHLTQNGKQLKLIKKISEYNAADTNTVHAILNVEGPHAFYGNREGKTLPAILADFWNNFDSFTAANRIFAMNIAHLQDNDFCNHAFGIQIFKVEPFYPNGDGISVHGIKLLEKMKAKNILVDIKHTSLSARQDLYHYRIGESNWPIVCTHAGLTGIRKKDRGNYFLWNTTLSTGHLKIRHFKPSGYLKGTSFNPSSINLYDEDVREIIYSGGLIGLSLDRRILGTPDLEMLSPDYPDEIFEEEIISPAEKDFFRTVERHESDEVLITDNIRRDDRKYADIFHARQFLNQVFHLFVIADEPDEENNNAVINKGLMAKRICIGSDFDGLISAVECCHDVTEMQAFKDLLLDNYDNWEAEFVQRSGCPALSSFISKKQLFDNIFYQNAVDFLAVMYQ